MGDLHDRNERATTPSSPDALRRRIDALIAAMRVRLSSTRRLGDARNGTHISTMSAAFPWVDGAAGVGEGGQRGCAAARLRARIGTSPDVPRRRFGRPSQSCKGRTKRQMKRLDFQGRADARVVRSQAGRCTESRAGCSGETAS